MNTPEDKFRETLQLFHEQVTKNLGRRHTLKNKLKILFTGIRKNWLHLAEPPRMPQTKESHLSSNKSTSNLEVDHSLRMTTPKLEKALSVSKSKSLISKRTSRDLSENQNRWFNCDWIYSSEESSRTLLFAIMTPLIVTENKHTFKYLEDRINDILGESNQFSELQLSAIGNHWEKMGSLLARSKTVRWQKILKDSIDKFPASFSRLACCTMLDIKEEKDFVSIDTIKKLAKQYEVKATLFNITYKQIESLDNMGSKGPQLIIGTLSHRKMYVISTKVPEYSEEQKKLRQMKKTFTSVSTTLLKEFDSNNHSLLQYKSLIKGLEADRKEQAVQMHFTNKLEGLQAQ